jgi:DNA-binding XRE family transcriptional regulator
MALNFSGQLLQTIRYANDLTAKEAGAGVGLSEHTIRAYEWGRLFPRAPTLGKLADLFDVPVDAFYEDDRRGVA